MTRETLSTLQTEVREPLYRDENKLSRINIKSPRVHTSAVASYYTQTCSLSLALSTLSCSAGPADPASVKSGYRAEWGANE